MLPWHEILLLIISTIESITGFILSSCVMAVSYRNWKKDISRNLCDLILLSMGLCNIALQCTMNTELSLSMIRPYIRFYREIKSALIFVGMFLLYLNFWLTAWLCVYYCIKIANFIHHLFFRVKLWISSVLQKLLLMSALGSFIISVPSLGFFRQIHPQENSTHSTTGNCSENSQTAALYISNIVLAAVLGCCLPFLLSLISIGLTLTSLCGHVWRMKQNTSDFSIPRLQVHSRAARTMILLVVLSLSVCIAKLYRLFSSDQEDTLKDICWYFILCYPTLQAFLLIQGNTKLRTVCQRILL
ncbi:hypothetical protein FKM82_003505, partial [Ascaphus truei]